MHYNKLFSTLLFICLHLIITGTIHVNAQQENEYRTTVKLKIDAGESIRPGLVSCLKSELSSLPDVTVVTERPDWELFIVADTVNVGQDNEKTAVISVLLSKPFDNDMFSFLVNEKYKEIFMTSSENLHELKTQILYTGVVNELHTMCKRIVTEFDSRFLEQERTEFDITNRNLKTLGQ